LFLVVDLEVDDRVREILESTAVALGEVPVAGEVGVPTNVALLTWPLRPRSSVRTSIVVS